MNFKIFFIVCIFFIVNYVNAQNTYLFVGSYVENEKGEALQVFKFENGKLSKVGSKKELYNSGYFELSNNGQFLYCAHDLGWKKDGIVGVYKFDPIKKELNFIQKLSSQGKNPCHVTLDPKGKFVSVSNYNQSSVAIYNIETDGKLNKTPQVFKYSGSSITPKRQATSHVHSSNFSPDGQFIYMPDLGTDNIHALQMDFVFLFKKSKKSTLKTIEGAGPRHFTFHPNGNYGYVINELNGTVVSYCYAKGKLKKIDEDFSYSKKQKTYASADIHISPDGRFLYTSNRWKDENTIAIFKIDSQKGTLNLVGHQSTFGDHPRNFAIDPTGNFLIVANKNTNNLVIFKRNKITGLLSKLKQEISINQPTCLKFKTYQ